MTYEQAIELAKKKDEEGFRFLYESTYRDKYYIALKYMQNEEDALDVLQDAYIRAFDKLDTLENAEKFPAWLGMIVANTAKNALVKKKPVLFSEMSTENEDGDSFEFQIEDERIEGQPELSYTKEETRELVQQMISSLSDEQRLCILMFYMEDMSIRDIAETLDCSENTVKSRLNYGRKNLKAKGEELQKKGYKLYGVAPLPLLLYLLRSEGTGYLSGTGIADLLSYQNLLKPTKGSPAPEPSSSGSHPNAEPPTSAAGNPAGQAAKQFIRTAAGKVAIGAVAVALTAGVIAAVLLTQSSDDAETAVPESSVVNTQETGTAGETPESSVEGTVAQESSEEIPQETEPLWKTAYAEVISDPAAWLLDTSHTKNTSLSERVESGLDFQALLDETSVYQYTLFDMNQDGTPELILNTMEYSLGFEDWFFCTCNEEGVYLIDAQTWSFRNMLAVCDENMVWIGYDSFQPEISITLITMSADAIEGSDALYHGPAESAPETEEPDWHSTEDTDYILGYMTDK